MRFLSVTRNVKHEKHGDAKLVAEVPQAENVPELIQFYNGEEEILSRDNKRLARDATQGPVLRLGKSSAETRDAWLKEFTDEAGKAKSYTPESVLSLGVNAKAQAVDSLETLAEKHPDIYGMLTPMQVLTFLKTKELPAEIQQLINEAPVEVEA